MTYGYNIVRTGFFYFGPRRSHPPDRLVLCLWPRQRTVNCSFWGLTRVDGGIADMHEANRRYGDNRRHIREQKSCLHLHWKYRRKDLTKMHPSDLCKLREPMVNRVFYDPSPVT